MFGRLELELGAFRRGIHKYTYFSLTLLKKKKKKKQDFLKFYNESS